ncbi:MAG: DUF1367 family protein [Rikenellaceae bacterium]|jgi:hypothetical protein|uniref:DUF1367 family protein n=1 Tax=Tenuifilum sp. TaxID=2760880 RepID=UPI00169CD3D3|nr:DUF1367 family protein [Rikenellaceae bacterium]HNV62447.1 DUF1367 family protein [Candidatus Cloacimonas acidaminovorans]HQG72763.1 DUF1367 family protein [Tenuifilum sp.]
MKFNVVNTATGLIPATDTDFDVKRKLKIGSVYQVSIREVRNYEFHKKYFALIQCAWEYQNEKVVEHFKSNIELFRKTVEMAAGHCDLIYSIERKEWIETPKSIAFDAMSESEFQDLYDNVLSVLFRIFLKHVTEEEFKRNLQYF